MVERIGLQATMDMGNFDAGMNRYIQGVMNMGVQSEKSGSKAQTALNGALRSVTQSLENAKAAHASYQAQLAKATLAYDELARSGKATTQELFQQQQALNLIADRSVAAGQAVNTLAQQQQNLATELQKVNANAETFGGKLQATLGGITKGLGAGIGGAIKGIGEIGGTIGKVGATITGFLGPIGKIGSVVIGTFTNIGKAATGILGGAFSSVSKIAQTAFGGLGKIVSGILPHFGRARDEMEGLGQQGQRTGGILQTALGVALGNVITNALNSVIGMVKNLIGELFNLGGAFQQVAAYERMTQTMGAMTGMELRRNTAVEKVLATTTTRIDLTQKEVAALEKAKDAYRKSANDLAIQQRAYEAMAASGSKSAEELDNQALKIDQTQRKMQDAAATIDMYSSKQGKLVTSTKTATEYTMTMAEAMAATAVQTRELIAWAEKLAIESPFEAKDVTSTMQSALAFGLTTKEAQRLTTAMLDWAAATGKSGDVISRMTVNLGQMKMAGKLSAGEIRQMSMMGFPILDILNRKMGYTAEQLTGTKRVSLDMGKTMEAIISSLEEDWGGMGKTMAFSLGGMEASIKELKSITVRNLYSGIFEAAKPYMAQVVETLSNPAFMEATKKVGERIGAKVAEGLKFAMALPGLGKDLFGFLSTGDTGKLGAMVEGISKLLNISTGEAIAKFQGFFKVLSQIQPMAQLVIAGVQSIGNAIGYLVTGDVDKLTAVWEKFAPTGKWEPIRDFLMGLREALEGLGKVISTFAKGNATDRLQAVMDAFQSLTDLGIDSSFANAIVDIAAAVGKFAKGMGDAFKLLKAGDIKGALGKVFETFKGFGGDIKDALGNIDWKGIWDTVVGKAKELLGKVDWSGIKETVSTGITKVLDNATEMAGKLAASIAKWWAGSEIKTKIDAQIPVVGGWIKDMLVKAIDWVMGKTTELVLALAGVTNKVLTDPGIVKSDDTTKGKIGAAVRGILEAGFSTLKEHTEELGVALGKLLGPIFRRALNYALTGQFEEKIDWGEWVKSQISWGKKGGGGKGPLGGLFDDVGQDMSGSLQKSVQSSMDTKYWDTTLKPPMEAMAKRLEEGGKTGSESLAKGVSAGKAAVEQAITKVADLVPERLEDEWMMASPSKVFISLGENVGESLAIGIEASSEKALKAVLEMSESIIELVKGMIEAINSMATAPDTTNLKAWGAALSDLLTTMMSTLTGFYDKPGGPKANAVDLTRRLAKSFNEVIAFVTDMADAFGALAEVDLSKVTAAKISEFMARTHDILVAIVDEAAKWGKTELEIKTVFALARKLTDQVLDVFRVVSESVDALNAIADYQGMNEADYRQKFRQWEVGMNVGLYYIWRVANFWRDVGLGHAKAFAEAVSGVFGIISEAIDALNAIVGFKGANENVLRSQFGKWEVGMNVAVYYIWRVARFWQGVALDGAIAFVEAAEKVLSIVSTGIEAIEAIVEFKPVGNLRQKAEAFGRNIIDIMDTLNRALGSLGIQPAQGQGGPPIPLTPEQIRTKFAGLAAFAEAVEAGIGFITPAIDAILNIGAFKAPENLYAAAQSFNMQIMLLMQALNSSLTWLVNTPMGAGGPTRMPTPEEVRAKFSALAEFSEAVQAGISFIAPAIEAMTSISAYKEIGELKQKLLTFGIDISKLMQGLVQAVEIVMNSFATGTPYFLTPDEVRAKFSALAEFSEAVQSVLGFIKPVIDAMTSISAYKEIGELKQKLLTFGIDISKLMQGLVQAVEIVMNSFATGTPYFLTPDEVYEKFEGVRKFSEAVQSVLGFIKPVIDAMDAISGYKPVKDIANKVKALLKDLDEALIWIAQLAGQWIGVTEEGLFSTFFLDKMSLFSTNVQAIIAMIVPVVEALEALAKYVTGKNFAKGIEAFKADLDTAMIALADLALNPNLSAENLAALKTFSTNLLGVIADLQSIVDALTAIGGYKAGAAVKAFQAVTKEVGEIVNYLWNSMQMVEGEMGVASADRFETAAKHIADAVARGMARLGELSGYEDEGENGSAFGTWFATQLGIAKTAIEALAQNSAWGNLKDAIDSVIEALKDLFGLIQSPPGGGGNQYRPLITAYEQIGNAASVATGKIKKLNQTIGAVTIPPQLETHSPPPFARGLDYIAEAARRAKEQFADMQNSMRNYSLPSTLMAAQAAAAVSNEVNVNMGGVNINNGMSEALFEARVRRVVKDAMRG